MTQISAVLIAAGVAILLIIAAVLYTRRVAAEPPAIIEERKKRVQELVLESVDPIRFSVWQSIKLGFGFGIGLLLAGLFTSFLFGALIIFMFESYMRSL